MYQVFEDDNGLQTQLIDEPGYNYWWIFTSPDNTKFITYRSDTITGQTQNDVEHAELWQYDIDGSNPQLLIDTNTYNWEAHGVAKYSPDGSKLLMAVIPENTIVWRGLVTDPDGQNPRMISNWHMIDPAWSPDGQEIVFCGFPNNIPSLDLTQYEIFTAPYDHLNDTIGEPVQITSGLGRVHDPAYSNAGDRICFSSGNLFYSDADIMVVGTDGSNLTTVFDDNGANGGTMFWSADDSEIWFHNATLFVNPFQIRKVNVSSGIMNIIHQSTNHGFIVPHMYYTDAVSIEETMHEDGVKVYPNPATDRLHIRLNTVTGPCEMSINTTEGRSVLKRISTLPSVEWDVSSLPTGFYILNIRANDLLFRKKLTVVH